MSYEHGIAAINLEMTDRVPRTEYSVERHWELVKVETGIDISESSTPGEKSNASQQLFKAWNFDLIWNILHIHDTDFTKVTKMGHASFEGDGSDFDNQIICPFNTPEEALSFNAAEEFGVKDKTELIKRFNDDYRSKRAQVEDTVNMTGLYVSLISGLIELFGWDMMLMAMGTDAERFGNFVTANYAKWISQYYEALAECDSPVIMIHDDIVWTSGPFTNPDWYRKFVFPNYKKLIAPLLDSNKRILYTCDGDFTMFLDDIVDCGFHGVVMEPATDMKLFAEKYGKTHVFVGNADTRILLSGTKEDIHNEVKRCMDIGKHCPGFFMAVGNHIPANTPVENALYYNQIYQELSRR